MSTKALRYNEGKRRWGLVHYKSLEPMIEVLEYGAEKYTVRDVAGKIITTGENNWQGEMSLRMILECAQRHLAAMMDGEIIDPESGKSHSGHIQANMMFYNYHKAKEVNNT